MKPCPQNHPLDRRYYDKCGRLRCRSCERFRVRAWESRNPARNLANVRERMRQVRRRERFWRAWQALGELRDVEANQSAD